MIMAQIECDTAGWKTNSDIPAEHRMNGPNILWLFIPHVWIQKGLKRRLYYIETGLDGNPKIKSYGPNAVVLSGVAMMVLYIMLIGGAIGALVN